MMNIPEDASNKTNSNNIKNSNSSSNRNNNGEMDPTVLIGADTPQNAARFAYPATGSNKANEAFCNTSTNDIANTIHGGKTLVWNPLVGNSNGMIGVGNNVANLMLNANSNDDNDEEQEEQEGEEKKSVQKVFKRHSPEHLALIDLCERKGWLDSALPMSKGPSADRDLQIYLKTTGFTRAQVSRKFKELQKYRQALSPDASGEAQAMAEVKEECQIKMKAKETKRQKQQAKKLAKNASTAFVSPPMGMNGSNAIKRSVTEEHPRAQSSKKAKHSQAPASTPMQWMLPPLDPREFGFFFGPTQTPAAGVTRPTSPFRKLSARIASPTPWGVGPPPPQLQRFYSWIKPNPNEAVPQPPSLMRLATGDVTNLLQRPIQDSTQPNYLQLRSQSSYGLPPQHPQASYPSNLSPMFSVTESLGSFTPNSTPRRGNLTPGNSSTGGNDLSDIVSQLHPYNYPGYMDHGVPNGSNAQSSFPSGDSQLFSPMPGMSSSFLSMGHPGQPGHQNATPHTMNASYASLPQGGTQHEDTLFVSPDVMNRVPTAVSLTGSSGNNSSISSPTTEQLWQQQRQQQQGAMPSRDSNVAGSNQSSSQKNENVVPSSFGDEFFG